MSSDESVSERVPARPLIDVSPSVGQSAEEVLGSADLPDNSDAGSAGVDDGDVSKSGRGSKYPNFGIAPFLDR